MFESRSKLVALPLLLLVVSVVTPDTMATTLVRARFESATAFSGEGHHAVGGSWKRAGPPLVIHGFSPGQPAILIAGPASTHNSVFVDPDAGLSGTGAGLHFLDVDSGNIELAVWIRNIEDQVYKVYNFDASNFAKLTINFLGQPRTVGMDLSISW